MHRIGISIGDPRGIGAEVTAKALATLPKKHWASFRVYAPRLLWEEACTLCQVHPQVDIIPLSEATIQSSVRELRDIDCARIALNSIDAASKDALAGEISAMVTAPVNKSRLQKIARNFRGHTEYIAQHCHSSLPIMLFAAPGKTPLRVALFTVHIPLQEVDKHLHRERLATHLQQLASELTKHFCIPLPRIAVLGLNPHAGENGSLGDEEHLCISPAIEAARAQGMNVHGPFSADAFFAHHQYRDFDAVLAMYHDQGLIPAKLLMGADAVNITLGLPFLRLSPAHGTAEDIAWQGIADARSMSAALELSLHSSASHS